MCFIALRELCSWVSNVIHVWLAQLAPCSQPMRSRTKTNPDLPAGIYPRQAPVACDYYGALLANAAIGRSIIALILFFRHSLEYCSSTDWTFSHAVIFASWQAAPVLYSQQTNYQTSPSQKQKSCLSSYLHSRLVFCLLLVT